MKTHRKPKYGFTLVELLVVITIIAVLAGVVFSVANRARLAAKASTCVSNLRQCGLSVHVIRDEGLENKGRTPPGYFPSYGGWIGGPGVAWRQYTIYDLIGEQIGACIGDGGSYRWTTHPRDTFLNNPLSEVELAKGIPTEEIDFSGHPEQQIGGFGYNHLVNGWTTPNSEDDSPGYKRTSLNTIDFPNRTILMAEQQTNSPGTIIGPYRQAPHGNYKDKAHCLFVDGHVEAIANDYLPTNEAFLKYFRPAVAN
ncbi:type II secretion system protein [Luteolibacter algae]